MNETEHNGVNNPIKPFSLIFFVELWERYGYYGMQALLVYFMIEKLGYSDTLADNTYAAYSALAYAFISIGGYIGDKIFGFKRTIIFGAIVLALGYLLLGINPSKYLYWGLSLIIAGNAMFKSNPSSLVSKLYAKGDHRIDAAYTMYYMAINIGSFFAILISPIVAERWGWNIAFYISFIGLLIAVFSFIIFSRIVSNVGSQPDFEPFKISGLLKIIAVTATLTVLSFFLLENLTIAHIIQYIAIVVVFLFFLKILKSASKDEKRKLWVCFILIFETIVFYILFIQRATSLNLYVIRNTRHFVFGIPLNPLSFQCFNSLWILAASPFLALLFTKLAAKKRDFSLPSKFAFGMFLSSLGFLLFKFASYYANSNGLVNGTWVFFAIGFMSLGEIFIGAIGLAMIAKLVPFRIMGFMMGTFYMAQALASILGGFIASLASIPENVTNPVQTLPIYTNLFFILGIITLVVSILMALAVPKLKKYIS